MKNIFMVAVIVLMTAACQHTILPVATVEPVSTPVANTEIINASGQTIATGHTWHSILQQPAYKPWFDKNYESYVVDTNTVKQLSTAIANTSVDIFLGSWCGDSKREVPRMIRILEQAGIDTAKIALIFVDNSADRYKQSPGHEERNRNIHHVPTFIIYNNNKETGRIVETPVTSLEKDLQAILTGQTYTPNYKAINYWVSHVNNRQKKLGNAQLQEMAATIKPLCKHYGEFNAYGYTQLAAKNNQEALNVFRLNTLMYPAAAGVFDSLGEALAKTGDKAGAIVAYEKVLALTPSDENAKKMLESLKK